MSNGILPLGMRIYTYRTIIEKDGKGYHGYVPALPGCHTDGSTIEETRKNLREAIEGILLVMTKYKQPIPIDTSVESFETVDLKQLTGSASYA